MCLQWYLIGKKDSILLINIEEGLCASNCTFLRVLFPEFLQNALAELFQEFSTILGVPCNAVEQ